MILKKGNVERIATGDAAQALMKKGFVAIDATKEPEKKADISKMKVEDLRQIAEEKGIEGVESLTKQELLKVLKEVNADE